MGPSIMETDMLTAEEREGLLEIISDLSKDATGCRLRFDYAAMEDSELESWYGYYTKTIQENEDGEVVLQAEAKVKWNRHIDSLVERGAGDRLTAIRWDMQAMGADDVGYYCYLWNLPSDVEAGLPTMMEIMDMRRAA